MSDASPAEKKPLSKKLIGIAVGILALLVFVYFASATVPEVVNGAASTVNNTGNSLVNFGNAGQNFARGTRSTLRGITATAREILIFAFGAGIVILLIKEVAIPAFKKKEGGGGGGHHAPEHH